MGIRITLFLLLLPLFTVCQTTDTKDWQWARQRLIIGTDAADYLNEITQTISVASTHVQSPTAKAVYDYLTGFLTTVNLTFTGTSSPVTLANSGGTDVTFTAGTGISLSASSGNITITNNATDQTVTITGSTGIAISGTYPNFTLSVTDQSATNEGILGVGAGSGTSAVLLSNTTGATGVTFNAGTGISISETTSANGGQITLTNTSPLGTGTVNYFTKWATSSTLSNTSLMYEDGNEVGINTTTPFAEFHVNNGDFGAYKNTTGSPGASLFLGDLNYNNASFFDKAPGLTAVYNAAQGVASDLGMYSYNGTRNLRAIIDYQGNFGIGTATPARLLHVAGIARITGSTGTATTITGRDGNGDISNVSVGSGLSLSGGTLSTTGGTGWILGGNTVGSLQTIGTNDAFDFPIETGGTEKVRVTTGGSLLVNTTSALARIHAAGVVSSVGILSAGGTGLASGTALYRGTGTFTSGFGYVFDGDGTLSGGNIFGRIRNGSNTANSQAIQNISVAGSTAADPYTQYQVEGANTWSVGIDNSVAADPFKIARTSALGVSTSDDVLIIETDGRASIGGAATVASVNLTVAGTGGIIVPSGNNGARPGATDDILRNNTEFNGLEFKNPNTQWHRITGTSQPTVSTGTGAGTGASATIVGTDRGFRLNLTTGTAPAANGDIVTITYGQPFQIQPYIATSPYNAQAATDYNKYYVVSVGVGASGPGGFTLRANGTLTGGSPGPDYVISFVIQQ